MYHYVRPTDDCLPYFQALHLDDFCAQLDYFRETGGFVSRDELMDALNGGPLPEGYVLTFDDGVSDHYSHVFPELRRRGLFGIFYVPTGQYFSHQLLDVHRIHYLLGRCGGFSMMEKVQRRIRTEMLSHAHVYEFQQRTYARQENDSATNEFKRIFNYYIAAEFRQPLLAELVNELIDERQLVEHFYVSPKQLREMQDGGMIIGGHSVTHPVLSKLSKVEQYHEINDCFQFLEAATGGLGVRTFCFPYGGMHSFNQITLELLHQANCKFALNVDPRHVHQDDVRSNLLMLPRYDCNQFQFGQVRRV